MINYVIINGVNSNTITGLAINELPPITKPQLRVLTEEIDGRDGDITTPLGYSAYDKTFTIGLFGDGYDINDIVSFFNDSGTIVFSNEPDKYYKFETIAQIDYESLLKFKTASITIHCQPFKYPTEEEEIEIAYQHITGDGEVITIDNTAEAPMKLSLKGNTSQTGTPTPDTPIPVNVVSGDNEVVVCGKNLLPIPTITTTSKGRTYKFENGELNITGNSTGENTIELITGKYIGNYGNSLYIREDNSIHLTPGTYTFSCVGDPGGVTLQYVIGQIGDRYANQSIGLPTGLITRTFVITEDCYFACSFYDYATTGTVKNFLHFQFEKNSSNTDYEPYQSQTYPINLGVENIYEGSQDFSGEWQYLSSWETASETFNGCVVKKRAGSWNGTYKTFSIKAGETYTYSVYAKADEARTGGLYIDSGVTPSALNINITTEWQRYSITFTANADDNNVRPRIENTTNSTTNYTYIACYQLEKGSKLNTYTPYGEAPIEMCNIPNTDYQDYFTKNSDGQWCKYNVIGKRILNGSEGWDALGIRYWLAFPNKRGLTSAVPCLLYCNYFNPTANAGDTLNIGQITEGYYTTPNYNIFFNYDGTGTNVAGFKTWLSTHNTIVYYVLATPYLSLIEDTTLIEQLDNIQNAMSYDTQTNILQTNNDKPFLISYDAITKGTNEAEIENIGNIYSKPTLDIKGTGIVHIYKDNVEILQVDLTDNNNIVIENMNAYDPSTNQLMNRKVIGNYNNITLPSGTTTLRVSGDLTKMTISNYSRWL